MRGHRGDEAEAQRRDLEFQVKQHREQTQVLEARATTLQDRMQATVKEHAAQVHAYELQQQEWHAEVQRARQGQLDAEQTFTDAQHDWQRTADELRERVQSLPPPRHLAWLAPRR